MSTSNSKGKVSNTQESWRPVVGFEGYYRVSDFGRVSVEDRILSDGTRNWPRKGRILKTRSSRPHQKYVQVRFCVNGKESYRYVHRLVAEAFIPNPENKPRVNHKDGNKSNNAVWNLEWATASEDLKHAYATKLRLPISGENHVMAKLTNKQVRKLRELHKRGKYKQKELAKMFKLSESAVSRLVNFSRFKDV